MTSEKWEAYRKQWQNDRTRLQEKIGRSVLSTRLLAGSYTSLWLSQQQGIDEIADHIQNVAYRTHNQAGE
jgi:hypothetical protein